MTGLLKVNLNDDDSIDVADLGGFETRHQSITKLFAKALENIEFDNLKIKEFYINTNDISCPVDGKITFGFTDVEGVVLCPDYTFEGWLEASINTYDETVNLIKQAGDLPPVYRKLFWIGNPKTQSLRKDLLELGSNHSDKLEIIALEVSGHKIQNFVSLVDHTKYRYLIDCGASGYSGRLKFLLHSNRPLFIVERERNKQEYFYKDLIPFQHYIPVNKDLSDLIEKLEWADSNYEEAKEIAWNAQQFCSQQLNTEKVIEFLSNQIIKSLS